MKEDKQCRFISIKRKKAYEMRISDWSSDVCSSDLMPMSAAARRNVPGISSGSVANSSSGRTSITTGPDGMPTRRTSLSDEIVFKTGMMRPFTKQDAILQPVASWGDRVPHATIMPCPSVLVNVRSCRPERGLPVRERAGRTQGDRAHLRISAYIGVCHCGQTDARQTRLYS